MASLSGSLLLRGCTRLKVKGNQGYDGIPGHVFKFYCRLLYLEFMDRACGSEDDSSSVISALALKSLEMHTVKMQIYRPRPHGLNHCLRGAGKKAGAGIASDFDSHYCWRMLLKVRILGSYTLLQRSEGSSVLSFRVTFMQQKFKIFILRKIFQYLIF